MTSFFDTKAERVVGSTKLAKMGIETVRDLMYTVPYRVAQPGELTPLASLRVGDEVTVHAMIEDVHSRQKAAGGGFVLNVDITDGTSTMSLVFFPRSRGHHAGLLKSFRVGEEGLFSGKVGEYRGQRQLAHPTYHMLREGEDMEGALAEYRRATPIYPRKGSVQTWDIHRAARTVVEMLQDDDVPDLVPASVREAEGIPGVVEVFRGLHSPETEQDWRRAVQALRVEEAFVLQTELLRRRAATRAVPTTARPGRSGGILDAFDAAMPYTLTAGQRTVGEQIASDLASDIPMMRLLQGDVGTGKTLVALRAILQVVDSGGQGALLAPTEVLAQQHYRNITKLMGPLAEAGMIGGDPNGTRVELLTAALSAPARRQALANVASGTAGIVVGTHSLLSEKVQFADLGVVVVDEQHRFGVEQRDILRARSGGSVHSLVMTATPIPRTVAMTAFGDLETSILAERPGGGAGVDTHLVPADRPAYMARVWQLAREAVDRGERVFVVCPRIDANAPTASDEERGAWDQPDEQEQPQISSVAEISERLRGLPQFEGIEVGILHSRMSTEAKDRAMAALADGTVPVLVSTTVIEVGVDVPAATIMVIMDADRFGLSQLHQLRGRVGRGSLRGTCFAVSRHLTDDADETVTVKRLTAFAGTTDGFVLAEEDLTLRREGDVLGAAQSGRASSLATLRVLADRDLIERARGYARDMLDADPELREMPGLAAELHRLDEMRLADYLEMS